MGSTNLRFLKLGIRRIGKEVGNGSSRRIVSRNRKPMSCAIDKTQTLYDGNRRNRHSLAAATTTITSIISRTRTRTRKRTSSAIGMRNDPPVQQTALVDLTTVRFFSSANTHHGNTNENESVNSTGSDEKGGPVTRKLDELISEGGIQPDAHQWFAAKELDRLYLDLMNAKRTTHTETETGHEQQGGTSPGFFGRFFGQAFSDATASDNHQAEVGSQGIYTYGGVGCGKTFLMELFYHALDDDETWGKDKQIVHYHKFMLNVHQFMHTSRQGQNGIGDGNPIEPVVDHILESGRLLCLDEFQVTDVADAMILKELFGRLWKKGCILVTTSNRPPRDLYLHGLQRDRFLPFVDLLEEKCSVVSLMDNETDYRMVISAQDDEIEDGEDTQYDKEHESASANDSGELPKPSARRRAKQVYFCGKDKKKVLQKFFYERAKGRPSNPSTLETQGRKVKIPMACKAKSICMFSFEDLCQKALGAADYLVIGQQFSTVFVYGIPKMTVNEINWLRRFITFVDSMYEWKVRLLLQTNAESVEEIFRVDDKEAYQQDEVFAFDRTRSRLGEMSSTKYLSSQWLGAGTTSTATTKLELNPSMADQWFQLVGGNLSQQSDDDDTKDNTTDTEEYYRQLFDGFDLNKDGVLDKDEIKALMHTAFGYEPVDLVVNEMIASIDMDQNGVIDLEEFCALLAKIKQHRRTQTG